MRKQNALKAAFLAALFGSVGYAASRYPALALPPAQRAEENLTQQTKIKGAVPDRLFEFGIAVGAPIFASPEIGLQVLKKIQVGSYFGLVPSGIIPRFNLPSITEEFFDGFTYLLRPNGDTSLLMVSPFIRFFPTERPFYLQLTWSVARSTHNIISDLTETATGIAIPDATVSSLVTLTEMLPTISVGYFFWRHVYFFNISLGATFLLTPTATATLSAELPLGMGGTVANQAVLNNIQTQINTAMNQAITQVRNYLPFVPSLMISTGIMF